jgi:hypothetical protein
MVQEKNYFESFERKREREREAKIVKNYLIVRTYVSGAPKKCDHKSVNLWSPCMIMKVKTYPRVAAHRYFVMRFRWYLSLAPQGKVKRPQNYVH